ncbi:hypothetical protein GLYMA_07G136650v4 [Glycine max]|nr:hypothetical protein GLYMA_07G136650v4 [Glycine max]KAH1086752.1 hypothetical protein GYH30_018316 [Glycine max]
MNLCMVKFFDSIVLCWRSQAMVVFMLLSATGPPIKRRAGLRIKQAGRGSYRGS